MDMYRGAVTIDTSTDYNQKFKAIHCGGTSITGSCTVQVTTAAGDGCTVVCRAGDVIPLAIRGITAAGTSTASGGQIVCFY